MVTWTEFVKLGMLVSTDIQSTDIYVTVMNECHLPCIVSKVQYTVSKILKFYSRVLI